MECSGYFQRTSQALSQEPCKQKPKCGLFFGEALGCGWILSGRRDSLPRAFSQHDHLCKGQENDLEACFIYSFLTAALLWGEHMEAISLAKARRLSWNSHIPLLEEWVQGNIWNAAEPTLPSEFWLLHFLFWAGFKIFCSIQGKFWFPFAHMSNIPEQSSLKICGANSWNSANVLS